MWRTCHVARTHSGWVDWRPWRRASEPRPDWGLARCHSPSAASWRGRVLPPGQAWRRCCHCWCWATARSSWSWLESGNRELASAEPEGKSSSLFRGWRRVIIFKSLFKVNLLSASVGINKWITHHHCNPEGQKECRTGEDTSLLSPTSRTPEYRTLQRKADTKDEIYRPWPQNSFQRWQPRHENVLGLLTAICEVRVLTFLEKSHFYHFFLPSTWQAKHGVG